MSGSTIVSTDKRINILIEGNFFENKIVLQCNFSFQFSLVTKKENAHNDPIYCCACAKISTAGDSA